MALNELDSLRCFMAAVLVNVTREGICDPVEQAVRLADEIIAEVTFTSCAGEKEGDK